MCHRCSLSFTDCQDSMKHSQVCHPLYWMNQPDCSEGTHAAGSIEYHYEVKRCVESELDLPSPLIILRVIPRIAMKWTWCEVYQRYIPTTHVKIRNTSAQNLLWSNNEMGSCRSANDSTCAKFCGPRKYMLILNLPSSQKKVRNRDMLCS